LKKLIIGNSTSKNTSASTGNLCHNATSRKHPTIDFLVYEEPEIDTEETPIIIWKAVKFTIADINLEVTATFTIPENGDIQQLNQKAYDTWVFTDNLPHLTSIEEKGEYWQHLLQGSIFELQFDH
jgi:hypothetical protein